MIKAENKTWYSVSTHFITLNDFCSRIGPITIEGSTYDDFSDLSLIVSITLFSCFKFCF